MSPRPVPSGPTPPPGSRTAVVPRLVLAACLILLFASRPGEAQHAPFPLERGEAVATCFSGYAGNNASNGIDLEAFVVAAVDVRNPPGALVGQHWPAPMYHDEAAASPTGNPAYEWKASTLGQVFGIALDAAPSPSIFVTATSAYFPVFEPDGTFSPGNFGPLGPGGIYRLDGTTGAICEHAQLDNSGPALGNVAFDRRNRQLFVSNLEDGTIVRLPAQSPCGTRVRPLGSYDHGLDGRPAEGLAPIGDDGGRYVPSSAAADRARSCTPIPDSGFTPLERRIWGVQVHEGRLYYSVWNEDQGRPKPGVANEIWSIGLLPDGDFDLLDVRREVEIAPLPGTDSSNPVSDIAFSADGRMLVAERVRQRDHGCSPRLHAARVLEYTSDSSGKFGQSVREVPVGHFSNRRNSAGGVDYGYGTEAGTCDATAWATGDTLLGFVYGLQGTPGFSRLSQPEILGASFFIDLDEDLSQHQKTQIGDVEVVRNDCLEPPCLDQVTFDSLCVVENGEATGDYTWRFRLRNETDGPVHHLFLSDLPPGVKADPEHVVFDPPVRPRGWARADQIAEVTFTGVPAGAKLELTVSIHDDQLVECCAETVTVELPVCECAQIVSQSVPSCFAYPFTYAPGPPFRYRVDLQNLSGRTAQYLFAAPVESDLLTPIPPDEVRVRGSRALATPAGPGGTTGSFQFLIDGPDARPGQEVCLLLSLHDSSFDECCSIPRCFTLPDCTIDLDDVNWTFDPIHDTIVALDRGELVLSGFGGGVGGIDVEISDADLFQAVWAPINPVEGQGAEIGTASFGAENQELASVEARELGGPVAIHAAFLQRSERVEVDLLDADGAAVASRTVSSREPVVSFDRWPAGFIMKDDISGITILGHEDTLATLPGGTVLQVAAVRVRPVDRSPRPSFASIALRVAGLVELRLRSLAAAVDCDGDGVPDAEAIERDPSLDRDGDGVPDSCRDDDGGTPAGKPVPDVRQGAGG